MEKTVQCSGVGQDSGLGVQMSVQMTFIKDQNMSENYTFGSHLHPGGNLGNGKYLWIVSSLKYHILKVNEFLFSIPSETSIGILFF